MDNINKKHINIQEFLYLEIPNVIKIQKEKLEQKELKNIIVDLNEQENDNIVDFNIL
jgi:hypothetical protein